MNRLPTLARLGALLLALLSSLACAPARAADERTLVLYNWAEYMPRPVLKQFTKETGIKVRYSTYDNNEAMFAKLKAVEASGGYDLVVPSSYYVTRMRAAGMLQPLDKNRLPNLKNLDPRLLDKPYDPGNAYSVPYLWGASGIAVDSARIDPATVTSWADLWKPEYRGRLMLLDDLREVFGIALKLDGRSINSRDPDEIRAAYEKLLELRPNVKVFNAESPKSVLLSGEVRIGQIYNGEAWMAEQANPKIRFVIPKEGPLLWVDNLVIPKSARHVEEAHAFIDFVLRPEIAKQIAEEVGYTTPNLAARALLAKKVRDSRTAYPSDADLERGEFQTDVGDALPLYEQYWSKLKAAR
ncbi:extracellular solute-binding protein [Plasticicumulans sp.]|uniref:extracellular solute-binding protein n=1 Tax=Plasticicumulans sp. TaxID=2307179 RepID=UPI002C49B115|nr:extracellular solute-binding protein [Plasticicumulans sp.]